MKCMYRSEMFIQPIKTEFPYLSGQTGGESFPVQRARVSRCGQLWASQASKGMSLRDFFFLPVKVSTPQKFIEILYYYTKIDSLFPSVYVTPLWSLFRGEAGAPKPVPSPSMMGPVAGWSWQGHSPPGLHY